MRDQNIHCSLDAFPWSPILLHKHPILRSRRKTAPTHPTLLRIWAVYEVKQGPGKSLSEGSVYMCVRGRFPTTNLIGINYFLPMLVRPAKLTLHIQFALCSLIGSRHIK